MLKSLLKSWDILLISLHSEITFIWRWSHRIEHSILLQFLLEQAYRKSISVWFIQGGKDDFDFRWFSSDFHQIKNYRKWLETIESHRESHKISENHWKSIDFWVIFDWFFPWFVADFGVYQIILFLLVQNPFFWLLWCDSKRFYMIFDDFEDVFKWCKVIWMRLTLSAFSDFKWFC